VQSGNIRHEVAVTYANESPLGDEHIGGIYKNYVRLIVPRGAKLVSGAVGEMPLALDESPAASASTIIAYPKGETTEIAALVEVPPAAALTLRVVYDLPFSVGPTSEYRYTAVKQPGTEADKMVFSLHYPSSWQVSKLNNLVQQVAGATTLVKTSPITYNTNLSQDDKLVIKFGP
jgi:hypothetical protein